MKVGHYMEVSHTCLIINRIHTLVSNCMPNMHKQYFLTNYIYNAIIFHENEGSILALQMSLYNMLQTQSDYIVCFYILWVLWDDYYRKGVTSTLKTWFLSEKRLVLKYPKKITLKMWVFFFSTFNQVQNNIKYQQK